MTEQKIAPTYRQRLTGTGTTGIVLMLTAPLVYAYIWSSWTLSDAWFAVPIIMLIMGPVLVLVGREHYDAAEDEAMKVIAAERIRLQKIKR